MPTHLELSTTGVGARRPPSAPTNAHRASRRFAAILASALCFASILAAPAIATAEEIHPLSPLVGPAPASAAQVANLPARRPDFVQEPASRETHQMADWVIATANNGGLPFIIVDKKDTRVFVFDSHGKIRGAIPALLGLARGDDSAPGIGARKLSEIRPEERTTPAGRFVASFGQDLSNRDVLWVDYSAALAIHRVLSVNSKERRLQRLAASSPLDHRITFGCINVPDAFYDKVVRPAFSGTSGIVYILPEVKTLSQVFFNTAS